MFDAVNLDLAEQIEKLEPGGHLCLFYEKDPAEQMPALVPFIRSGLALNEQFIYVADDQTSGELTVRLEQNRLRLPVPAIAVLSPDKRVGPVRVRPERSIIY